jgi:hypothetical protein
MNCIPQTAEHAKKFNALFDSQELVSFVSWRYFKGFFIGKPFS